MIKVKLFEKHFGCDLDNDINKWVTENDVEVIDVKFSTCFNGRSIVPSAMLIYKEKQD